MPFTPSAVVAFAETWPGAENLPDPPVAWPGPALPGPDLGGGFLTCVTATGASATAVIAAAAKANRRTPWTFGGTRWDIGLRPLLPDETKCQDLRH